MHIIKGTEPITVARPVFCWFGQPGIGKSSLGYSTRDPLLLDFDAGAHRAANRRDTLQIATWADVVELMNSADALAPYATVVVDTVGRCLDLMSADIIANNPKMGNAGNLSLQGYGVLKARFRGWVTQLRALGKDVALIAHEREDKDGDTRITRPDIIGASLGEVLKTADFVGFVYMAGKDRVLDFSPSDRWTGKNPAQWPPFKVPPVEKAQSFMADLYDRGREALGKISAASAGTAQLVEDWRGKVAALETADAATAALVEINKLAPVAMPQVKRLLKDRTDALGLAWNAEAKAFKAPEPLKAATAPEGVQPAASDIPFGDSLGFEEPVGAGSAKGKRR